MRKSKGLIFFAMLVLLFSLASMVSAQGVTLSVNDKLTFDEPSVALLKYASFFVSDLGDFGEEPLLTLTVNNDFGEAIEGQFAFNLASGDNQEVGYVKTKKMMIPSGENSWEIKAGGITNVELLTDVMEEDMTKEEIMDTFDFGDIEDWETEEGRGDEDWVKENILDWTQYEDFSSDDIQDILNLSLPAGTYILDISFIYETPDGANRSTTQTVNWQITNPDPVAMESPREGSDDLTAPEISWMLPELPDGYETTSRITIWDRDYGSGTKVIERKHTSGYNDVYTTTITSNEYEFVPGRWYRWTVNLIGPTGKAIGGGNDDIWEFALENTLPSVDLDVTAGVLDDLWEGDQVSFKAEIEDEGTPLRDLSITWRINGNEVAPDPGSDRLDLTYTFDEPDEYIIEVVATDIFGDSQSKELNFTVQDNLPPEVAIINEDDKNEFVVGEAINLTADINDPDGEIARIAWYLNDAGASGDGTMVGTGEDFDMTLGASGDRKITLLAEDNRGEVSRTVLEFSVAENQPPAVNIINPESDEYLFGEIIELQAEATDDLIADPDISWEVVGVKTIDSDTYSIPEKAGEITLRAWTRDEQGQLGEDFVTLEAIANTAPSVNIQSPEPGASFTLGSDEEQLVMNAVASASDPDVDQEINWSWVVNKDTGETVAQGETGVTPEFEFSLEEPGLYTLTATAIDSYGDLGEASLSFNVIAADEIEEDLPPLDVDIILPEAGTSYYVGEEAFLEGTLVDAEITSGTVFTWVIEDHGSIGTGREIEYSFSQPGSLTLKLLVNNEKGQSGQAETEINIEPNNAPEVSLEGAPDSETGMREGDEELLTAVTEDEDGHDVSLSWRVNYTSAPAEAVTDNQLDLSLLPVGSYNIQVIARDELGAKSTAEVSFPVKANQPPVIEFTEIPDKVVTGEEVNIVYNITDPEEDPLEVDVEIINPEGETVDADISDNNINFNAEVSGNYTVTVKATDDKGAEETETAIVESVFNQAPTVKIISPEPGIAVVVNQEFNVELEVDDPEGDPISSVVVNEQEISDYTVDDNKISFPFDVAETGVVTLNVSVSDNKGKTKTTSVGLIGTSGLEKEVEENENPQVSIFVPDKVQEITFGKELTFNAEATDPDNTPEEIAVNWFINEDQVGSGTSHTHSFIESGTQTVRVEAVDIHGAKGSAEVDIAVQENEAPTANIISPVAGEEIDYQQAVNLEAEANDPEGHDINYVWLLDNKVLGTGNPNQYTFAQPGNHDLTLRITDGYDKGREYTFKIKVLPPEGETLPPEIVEPLDRTVIMEGTEISLVADNLPEEGQINWRSSLAGAIANPEAANLTEGEHRIMLMVDDIQVDAVTVFVMAAEIKEEEAVAVPVDIVDIKGSVKLKHEEKIETLNSANYFEYEFYAGDMISVKGNNYLKIKVLFYEKNTPEVYTLEKTEGVYRFTEDGVEFIEGETLK